MFARLGCLFVVVPLVELALLVQVGRWVGVFPTVALVAVTGLAGAALARAQGTRALVELQRELGRGEPPARAFLDGASILVGGLLLLTPGILSDLLGFALLLPLTRRWLQRRAMDRILRGVREGRVHVTFVNTGGGFPGGGFPGSGSPGPGAGGGEGERSAPPPRDQVPGESPPRPPRPGEIIQEQEEED